MRLDFDTNAGTSEKWSATAGDRDEDYVGSGATPLDAISELVLVLENVFCK